MAAKAKRKEKRKLKEKVHRITKTLDELDAERKKLSASELRARAALARAEAAKVPDGRPQRCANCDLELPPSLVPFKRLEFTYCSTRCVKSHMAIVGVGN